MVEVRAFQWTGEPGDTFKWTRDFYKDIKLNLPDGTYDMGIDQSTSCTGISFKPLGKDFIVFMEVKNLDRDSYYVPILLKFIDTLLHDGVNIRYAVTEDAMNYLSGLRSKLLVDLHDRIMKFLKEHPRVERVDTIMPASWRNGLMPKVREGDRRKKATVVEAVYEIYPGLTNSHLYCNSDVDGLESVGIILGYRAKHGITDEDSILKNVGKKNTMKKGIAFFKYVTSEDIVNDKEVFDTLGKVISPNIVQKQYNEEETLYNNVKMSLVDDLSVFTLQNPVTTLSLLTHMRQNPKEGRFIMAIVIPEKLTNNNTISYMYNHGYFPVVYD